MLSRLFRFSPHVKIRIKREFKSHIRRCRWDHTTVPEIRLEGKWLEELGFEQGKTVKVIQENKVLVVVLEENSVGQP